MSVGEGTEGLGSEYDFGDTSKLSGEGFLLLSSVSLDTSPSLMR